MRFDRGMGRKVAAACARLATVLGAAAVITLFGILSSQSRELTVRGTDTGRHGRILLTFDEPTKVRARTTNGVLILSFSDAATIRSERLADELPAYVGTVRRDPDGKGLRIALTRPYRTNVLEAAERVYVDLLPENWSGLPPALPPEVVAELGRRAGEAEARARDALAKRMARAGGDIAVAVAQLPTLTRLVFAAGPSVPIALETAGEEVELRFGAAVSLDLGETRGRLAPAVRDVTLEEAAGGVVLKLLLAEGHEARGFRENEGFVLDIASPAHARAAAPPVEALAPAEPAPVPPPSPVPAPTAPLVASSGPGVVKAATAVEAETLLLRLPFSARTAAAAFERGGTAHVAFHTPDRIDLGTLPEAAAPFVRAASVERHGAFAVLRLDLAGPHLVRLAPQGHGWAVSVGETGLVPSEPLAVGRAVDGGGRTVLRVPLADPSGVVWLDGPGGERVALATAYAPARGLAKPHRFVDAAVLPSAHGVAVEALADDVAVLTGIEGVTIAREGGLSVSLADLANAVATADQTITREQWLEDREGPVRERVRRLAAAAAEAPVATRTEARIALARSLLANGLEREAVGVLAAAEADDPPIAANRGFGLLRGIVLARLRRDAEARTVLAGPMVGEAPEAVLWTALLDVRAGRFSQALLGFRRAQPVLARYPDELQALLRSAAARAAIEAREFGVAEAELAAAAALTLDKGERDELALLRARLHEAGARTPSALDGYRRLAEGAERPVAAEATLHWVALARREGAMDADEAVARLETLASIWRGDGIEAATVARLGRLYAEAGRWREAFAMARTANRIFPDHPATRELHEEASRLFENLFIGGKGETLSRLDALALYFDFKEFTPIGRRGDEIVRGLADRLIELDLLDQAADLLEHQVAHRLTGAARATVGARLAAVRLMDGKPQKALAALQGTRLPDLPAPTRRARALLEARALSDLSRTDLALEVLDGEEGTDVARLRADILWSGRRWREAGEAHEELLGPRWQGGTALSDEDRRDVIRAAIAYSLAEDALALDRLRSRYAPKMADSLDARTFAVVAAPNVSGSRAFREIARGATSADTLAAFLAEYRKRYPEAAVAERRRAGAAAAPAEAPPRS